MSFFLEFIYFNENIPFVPLLVATEDVHGDDVTDEKIDLAQMLIDNGEAVPSKNKSKVLQSTKILLLP